MTWDDVVSDARQFPLVDVSMSYGEPSLKVRKKLLTRHRVEDDSLVRMDVVHDERASLIARYPAT